MATKEALTRGTDALSVNDFARLFDHTLLSPTAVHKDYAQLCKEAIDCNFFSVCVPPSWLKYCGSQISNSEIELCTVVGFPLGYNTSETKAQETSQCVDLGATEIDMVLAISQLRERNFSAVEEDIQKVVTAAQGKLVKVILETCYLSREEIIDACKLCESAGADFVKTSTGFGTGGATPEHVSLMRETVGSRLGVKASGGIRKLEHARTLVGAGANRIGASQSVAILQELNS
ncbi:MAG: deoxyribose-phosphate aldolase [Pseudomonadota bacterium]